MFVSNLIHEITLKTALFQKKTVLRENHLKRESRSLNITIQLYRFYKHESPGSGTTTIYLSSLLHLKYVKGGNVYTGKHEKCSPRNVWNHRDIKDVEKYTTLDISLDYGNLEKIKVKYSEQKEYLVVPGKGLITSLGIKTMGTSNK